MIRGIHHVALVVRDLERTLPYYCAAAGLHRLSAAEALALSPVHTALMDPDDSPLDQCLLAGPNGYLKILSPRRPSPALDVDDNPINRPGIRHFCVQNQNCSILETAVLANRGSLIASPLDLGTGNQYAYARDPEGNIMEIEGLPYAPAHEPTWMGHVAVVTQNMGAAVAFYGQLFGSGLQNRGHFGPGPQLDRMGGLVDARIEGAWLPAGNMLLEFWQFHFPEYPLKGTPRELLDPGYSHMCLETGFLEGDAARVVELGGELITEIKETDAVRSIFARDPEGNVIELLEFREIDGPLSIAALANPAICALVDAGR